MPLQSAHVFASHIGHTGKTTITFQMSCSYAKKNPHVTVLVMDFAEEGDLTKRFLGGVDNAAAKMTELNIGGIFKLLSDAKAGGGLTAWLWSDTFDVAKHAIRVNDHNKGIPSNLLLISSGAYPRDQKPMEPAQRKKICDKITSALEKSATTWKLFCDTDGDRRPAPFTMIAYGLCSEAIVPLHLNKGDLDRTETMLGMLNDYRQRGESKARVRMIVWNFVNSTKNAPSAHKGQILPFTPTKVNLDILDSNNARLFKLSQELPQLFLHGESSVEDFTTNGTCILRLLADNALKPSEEMGLPFVEMIDRIHASGKTQMKFKSGEGGVEYTAGLDVIEGVDAAIKSLEARFEAMTVSGGSGSGGYHA